MGACVRSGRWREALRLLEDGCRRTDPDVVAHTSAIAACSRSRQWDHVARVLAEMRVRGMPRLERLTWSCQGDMAQMLRQIRQGPSPDAIACNTTVVACARGQLWTEALQRLNEMQSKRLVPGDLAWAATITACERSGASNVSRELSKRQALERAARARLKPEELGMVCDADIKPVQRGAEWERALQMLAVLRQQSARLDSCNHMRQQVGEVLSNFEQSTKSPGGRPLGARQTSEGARAAILELQRRTSSRPGPAAPARAAIAADPRLRALVRADMPRPRREVAATVAALPAPEDGASAAATATAASAALTKSAVAVVDERAQVAPAATKVAVPAALEGQSGPRGISLVAAAPVAGSSDCSRTLPLLQAERPVPAVPSVTSVPPPAPFGAAPLAAAPLVARVPSAGSLIATGSSARVSSLGPRPLATLLGSAAPRKVGSPVVPAMHPMLSASTLATPMPGATGSTLTTARPAASGSPLGQGTTPSPVPTVALGPGPIGPRLTPLPAPGPSPDLLGRLRPVSFPAFPPAPPAPGAPRVP